MLGELQPWFSGWPSAGRFRRDMDELLDRFSSEDGYRSSNVLRPIWPAVESFVKGGNWVVRFDLPGAHPNDIDVSAVGNTLTIRASREFCSDGHNQTRALSFGRFERSLALPKGLKSDQIKARYEHGVLELTIPASADLLGRKIPIEIDTEETKRLEHQAE